MSLDSKETKVNMNIFSESITMFCSRKKSSFEYTAIYLATKFHAVITQLSFILVV